MTDDTIRYDLIVQDALRDAVRKILTNVSNDGLPGEHHFFITFKTEAPGVQLSDRMRQEYPDEMTVVLQHQFWDMNVDDDHFEVGLSFRNVPEKLSVPFSAMTGFADPSVQFALRFETDVDDDAPGADIAGNDSKPGGGKPNALALQTDTSDPAFLAARQQKREQEKFRIGKSGFGDQSAAANTPAENADDPASQDEASEDADAEVASADSKVVSIDAFRKKT